MAATAPPRVRWQERGGGTGLIRLSTGRCLLGRMAYHTLDHAGAMADKVLMTKQVGGRWP